MVLGSFELRKSHDSLYYLNDWRLPYPVYRFTTGDVDGDGVAEALVGVIKKTRFHREEGRRLFIFHNIDGHARPLWLGSKLGGTLQDFRYAGDGAVRAIETTADGRYVVSDYRWQGFGLAFDRFLMKNAAYEEALRMFDKNNQ